MENENHKFTHADNTWFGMSPIAVLGILAVLVAVSLYMFSGGFGSRVATTPMSPTTTTSPGMPSTPTTR